MPCNDVGEYIRIAIDDDGCLKSYRLLKGTCGKGVGLDSLLEGHFRGWSVEALLATDPEQLLEVRAVEADPLQFLQIKHLLAIRSALQVYAGVAAGGLGDLCTVTEISFEDGEQVVEALLNHDVDTSEIEACGGCGGG